MLSAGSVRIINEWLRRVLPRVPVIMIQQAAEYLLAFYSANRRRWLPVLIKNSVADEQGLMWPLLIIITKIRTADAVELSKAEAEEVIETFLLRMTDIRFNY